LAADDNRHLLVYGRRQCAICNSFDTRTRYRPNYSKPYKEWYIDKRAEAKEGSYLCYWCWIKAYALTYRQTHAKQIRFYFHAWYYSDRNKRTKHHRKAIPSKERKLKSIERIARYGSSSRIKKNKKKRKGYS
jgi:hypothetical protein